MPREKGSKKAKKGTTPAGLEPARASPIDFESIPICVDREDESSVVSRCWNLELSAHISLRVLLTTALAWCLPMKKIVVKFVYIG